ncbi:MAG: lactate utilization protein C [Bacteroidota bacterium]
MEESTNREKVLKKIRASLLSKTDNPFPRLSFEGSVFPAIEDDIVVHFAERAEEAGARFFLIDNELDFMEAIVQLGLHYKWKQILCAEEGLSNLLTECELPHSHSTADIETMEVALSTCECLIARTGSVVFSSSGQTRSVPAFAPFHIVLGKASHICPDIKDAMAWVRHKYSRLPGNLSIVTGTSSTADIDGEVVRGVHGPVKLYIFVIDDRDQTS